MESIWAWIQANWIHVVAIVWTLDQLLKVIASINPERDWIDNVADGFGVIVRNFFPKK